MNVYDFDETIYHGDSTKEFCIFLLKRHPALFRFIPAAMLAFWRYLLGRQNKTEFKQKLFRMFSAVPNIELEVAEFWQQHLPKIKSYYKNQQRPDDVIVSASPTFLLEPCCQALGIDNLIASRVNPLNGTYIGLNCHGNEKVRRFLEAGFSVRDVEHFYSDSYSDSPLAAFARDAFLVLGNDIRPWGVKGKSHKHEKLRDLVQKLFWF